MPKGSGGGGNGGRSGGGSATPADAGQPGEVVRDANKANGMISAENLPNAYFQRDKLETLRQKVINNYPATGTEAQQNANATQRKNVDARLNKLGQTIKKSESRLTKEGRYQVLKDAQYRETTKRKASKDNIKKLAKEGRLYQ